MSSTEEADNLRAGHAPAVKVGGMRVTQHKPKHENEEATEMTPEEVEEFGAGDEERADPHHQSVVVSGAIGKGDKDFPAAAVKAYHDKPLPTHQKPTQSPKANIQQPRR